MGQDGGTANPTVARDAMSYSLGYYTNDYKPVGGSSAGVFNLQWQWQPGNLTGKSLFNGNIGSMTVALSKFRSGQPVGYTYRYDQLNRLKIMRQHHLSNGQTAWNVSHVSENYREEYAYDANGNITGLNLPRMESMIFCEVTLQSRLNRSLLHWWTFMTSESRKAFSDRASSVLPVALSDFWSQREKSHLRLMEVSLGTPSTVIRR